MRWQAKILFHVCKSKNIIPSNEIKNEDRERKKVRETKRKYPCDDGVVVVEWNKVSNGQKPT